MVRFKIENIVHPSIRPHAVDNFKCPICLCVLYEPVQTAECHHLFCANCLMSSDLAAFPAEGPGWRPLQEVNKVVLRQLHALKVYCPHHREAAKEARDDGGGEGGDAPNGAKRRKVAAKKAARGSAGGRLSEEPEEHCSWEGDYGALLSKHLGECPLHAVDCPRGCGAKVRRKGLGVHDETCSKNFQECGICGEQIRPEEVEQHRREKAELHAQILERKLAEETVQRKAAEKRLEESTAEKQLEKLGKTLATFQTDTSKRMGLLEGQIERLLRATPTNKATWTFKVKDVLEQAQSCGWKVLSTPFELLGCGPLKFSLFPCGGGVSPKKAAMQDKVHLFLEGPFKVAGRLSVQQLHGGYLCAQNVWSWTLDVDPWHGKCSKGRLPTQAAFATCKYVKISFEATEVIPAVNAETSEYLSESELSESQSSQS